MSRAIEPWQGRTDDTPIPARAKDRTLQLQKDCCACCGLPFNEKRKPEFDHIIAIILGGANCESNIQALCGDCHRPKTTADTGAKSKLADIRKKRFALKGPKRPFPRRADPWGKSYLARKAAT